MSKSNDAILAFGFSLEELRPECLESSDLSQNYENFEDMVVALNIIEPDKCFEYEGDSNSPEWKKYYEKVKKIKEACPVELIWFCSYDYPMYFVALKNTKITAHRSYTKLANLRNISIEELDKLKEFCKEYKIKWKEPNWFLFGMNG